MGGNVTRRGRVLLFQMADQQLKRRNLSQLDNRHKVLLEVLDLNFGEYYCFERADTPCFRGTSLPQ